MIRGYVFEPQPGGRYKQVRIFADPLELNALDMDEVLPELAEKHGRALSSHALHQIEIEFLDEPNQLERFFRMGTTPVGMIDPVEVDLSTSEPA